MLNRSKNVWTGKKGKQTIVTKGPQTETNNSSLPFLTHLYLRNASPETYEQSVSQL